jgi:hypothetical protein
LLAFSHTTPHTEKPEWKLRAKYFPVESTEEGAREVEGIWVSVRDFDRLFRLRRRPGEEWGVEMFDLSSDPIAERDRFDPSDPAHLERARDLESYKKLLVDNFRRDPQQRLSDEEEIELLRSLGYVE